MRWLIAIGFTCTLAAGAARAATPAEIACASYEQALAGETDAGKRAGLLKLVPDGCEMASPKSAAALHRRKPSTAVTSDDNPTYEGMLALNRSDYAQAMALFRKAAAQGDESAQGKIGYLYEDGLGVPVNYAEAMHWYRLAAAQNDYASLNNIGFMYQIGEGVAVDNAQAMRWYKLASDQGYAKSTANIGYLYAKGLGVTQDYRAAMHWFQLAADSGTEGAAMAQGEIGYLYANGLGVAPDLAQARIWFIKGAGGGDAASKTWLAQHPQTTARAVPPVVQVSAAQAMKNADDAKAASDSAGAQRWFLIAAKQGDANAQYAVGFNYQHGQGVTANGAEAIRWYLIASGNGNGQALVAAGNLYIQGGAGLEPNYVEAVKVYQLDEKRLGAATDDADGDVAIERTSEAMVLGDLYSEGGHGLPQDLAQARTWFSIAAAGGDDTAKAWLAQHPE